MSELIDRQQAIDKITKRLFETAFNNVGIKQNIDETLVDVAENRLGNWFDELPSVQSDTTTHESIPVKTGKNDGDKTSGDCISRQAAINEIHEDADWLAAQGSDWQTERMERDKSILMSLPTVEPETIRCRDCKYYREYGYVNGQPKFLPRCTFSAIYVNADDFCSKAERREE